MEAQGFDIGYREHVLRMKLINKVEGLDATENYFNSLPASVKNTSTALRTLLFCYCEFNKVDKALDVFSRMDCMNLIDVALPITDLMMLYVKLGQPEKVPPLMEEMKKRNIQPSAYAYNLLIHSYSCLNDPKRVERTFKEMKRENEVQCGWTTYSNLVIFYTRSGQTKKAKATLKKMEEHMDSNNSECFNFLISLYAKIYDIKSVHRIWKSLKSKFKQVTSKSNLIMLEALSKQRDINVMKKWYKEWESTCFLFDIRLANIVIGTYLIHGKPDEAQLIFRRVLDRSQGPIFEACEHFMNYYLKKEQIKQALLYLKVATSKNGDKKWQPKEDIVSGFLNYFKKHDDFSSTKQFCELVKEINCIDGELYHSLLTQSLEKEQKMYDLLLTDLLKDYE